MKSIQKQSGLALLLFLVTVIGFTIAGFSGLLTSSVYQQNEQIKVKNIQVLEEAKESLLSYAVNYSVEGDFDKMGKLPCPDAGAASTEGYSDPNCGARGINSVGFFPFKTLALGKIEDGSGECLWYVVSGDYKNFIDANMLNWDSVGFLNLVDENDLLKHGDNESDFPIAFIISPGASINQDRSANGAGLLDGCKANFDRANYLEGGPFIDYSVNLPATADTLWEILTTSNAASMDSVDYNDQVIAIYKNELWDRIVQMGQLETDNNSPVDTLAETVTQQLANCLRDYGNDTDNTDRTLPFAAPTDLGDYRLSSQYDDSAGLLFGRYPQIIRDSEAPENPLLNDIITEDDNFVYSGTGTGYCGSMGLATNEVFWKNWKDHFFYVVGDDFKPHQTPPPFANRCDDDENCITVDSNNDLAAVVFFAGRADAAQNRDWTPTTDNKNNITSYLNGVNATMYDGTVVVDYSSFQNDYAYCIEFDDSAGPGSQFSTIKCRDIP